MTCAACQAHVEKAVNKVSGVQSCTVNLLTNSMVVEYDATTTPETIISAVEHAGYGASLPGSAASAAPTGAGTGSEEEAHAKDMLHRIVWSAGFLIILMYIAMGSMMGLPQPSFFVGEENMLVLALVRMYIL